MTNEPRKHYLESLVKELLPNEIIEIYVRFCLDQARSTLIECLHNKQWLQDNGPPTVKMLAEIARTHANVDVPNAFGADKEYSNINDMLNKMVDEIAIDYQELWFQMNLE